MRNYYDRLRTQKDEYDNYHNNEYRNHPYPWGKKQKQDGSLVNVNVHVNYYCDQEENRRISPDTPVLPNVLPDMLLDESITPNTPPTMLPNESTLPNTLPGTMAYSPAPNPRSSI